MDLIPRRCHPLQVRDVVVGSVEIKVVHLYSVSNLVYNSDRPNVSLQVRKSGTVSLASRKDKPTSVPLEFNTFIFRNALRSYRR
jgi:hypothetical protein